jgi:GNAT superfamily N-acetyltransferase
VLVGTLLDLIWVRPESRSQGVGSALMEAIERKAAAKGSVLTLEVWAVNRRAVEFYERRGFSVSATGEDPQTGLDKLVLQKVLPPVGPSHD